MRLFSLLVLVLWVNSSCNGLKPVSLQEVSQIQERVLKLKKSPGIEGAEKVYYVNFSNTYYGYLRNDLESWANTAKILEFGLLEWWKLPQENFRKASGRLSELSQVLEDLPDDKETLIFIYFSSHHEKNGELLVPNEAPGSSRELGEILARKKRAKVVMFFDTCYALYGQQFFPIEDRFAYLYTASKDEKCYDFRLAARRPSLKAFCKPSLNFMAYGLGIEESELSPFGFAFLEAHRRESSGMSSASLGEFMRYLGEINQELCAIPSMSRYPQFYWQASPLVEEIRLDRP